MNWPNPLCVIIQNILNPNLIKLKICSVRKAQFEKWSYDHNRKGPSQHERQHQSSYKSVGTLCLLLQQSYCKQALILT